MFSKMSISKSSFQIWAESIAEINLPLKNKDNKSIIYPIEFDKIIDETSPENAHFPQKEFYTYEEKRIFPKLGDSTLFFVDLSTIKKITFHIRFPQNIIP